jgi:hypothetical protein
MELRHWQPDCYHVEPFIAMNMPEPQPKPRYFTTMDEADTFARQHTLTAPWRYHAQLWYTDELGTHLLWYHRDLDTPDRAVVITHR